MVDMICVKGDNPHYYIHLSCKGHGINIVAEMPEQITGGITSEWESLLPYRLSSLLGNAIGSALSAVAMAPQLQDTSFQSWMGSSPIEIPLQLQFDAQTDAGQEVHKPIMTLKSLAAPVNGTAGVEGIASANVLYAPGPVSGGTGGYGIDVRIGKILYLKDCILRSANETFHTMLDDNGYPISGDIELTFSTSKVFGNIDILQAAGIPVSRTQ